MGYAGTWPGCNMDNPFSPCTSRWQSGSESSLPGSLTAAELHSRSGFISAASKVCANLGAWQQRTTEMSRSSELLGPGCWHSRQRYPTGGAAPPGVFPAPYVAVGLTQEEIHECTLMYPARHLLATHSGAGPLEAPSLSAPRRCLSKAGSGLARQTDCFPVVCVAAGLPVPDASAGHQAGPRR